MNRGQQAEFDALELRLSDALLEFAWAYAHAGGRIANARRSVKAHRTVNFDQIDRLITAARASTVIIRALFDEVADA